MRRVYHCFLGSAAVLAGMLISAVPVLAQFAGEPFGGGSGGFGGGFGASGEPVVSVAAHFSAPAADQPARLFITATIKLGWHIYSITQGPGGPVPTTISVRPSDVYGLAGDFRPIDPPEKNTESVFPGVVVESHHGSVTWYAPIELVNWLEPAAISIEGVVRAQACDANACIPPREFPFTAVLGPGFAVPEMATAEAGASQSPATAGLAAMLIAAFFGGLILNLMPCVLPVLSLKLLTFVEQGGQSRGQVFVLNLWYSAGLMLVFLILATLSASFSLAWGEQFTYTWFKVTLTALVFVMALSFLGVWEIPIPGFVGSSAAGQLQVKEGAVGAFFKGVFTTILATPCTGPFLGYVFGFTLKQPAHVSYLIFSTVGLGMAAPYLIVGALPELIRFLPKPGTWMETLKQVMAFLLLGTVVYLFTTMSERYFIPTLTLLVGLWFACWLIGRTPLTAPASKRKAAWIGGAATAGLVGIFAFTVLIEDLKLPWETFSRQALAEARKEGKTVMVDFTADWCPNCKWNLAWAIDTKRVNELVRKNRVVPMIADWTDPSPTIKKMLTEDLQRQTIPVLAIWPAGASDENVIIMDGILKESHVLEALERAGPSAGEMGSRQAEIGMSPL
ncbi:MAG: thioredoxin family protein [Planctomycetota bacterium]